MHLQVDTLVRDGLPIHHQIRACRPAHAWHLFSQAFPCQSPSALLFRTAHCRAGWDVSCSSQSGSSRWPHSKQPDKVAFDRSWRVEPSVQQSSAPLLWGSMIIARAFLRWVMLPSRCWPLPSRPSHSRPCLRLAISGTYTTSRHPAQAIHLLQPPCATPAMTAQLPCSSATWQARPWTPPTRALIG